MTQSTNNENTSEKEKDGQEIKNKAQQVQKLKFYAVVAGMSLLCIGVIWFLFKPAPKSAGSGSDGINLEIPDASVVVTYDDKRKAIEFESLNEKNRDKIRTLHDFNDDLLTIDPLGKTEGSEEVSEIKKSHSAFEKINLEMSSFYSEPKADPQVAQLQRQVERLNRELQDERTKQAEDVDPYEMMERSYELASRYFPTQGAEQVNSQSSPQVSATSQSPSFKVDRISDNVTSLLGASDYSDMTNRFNTAVGSDNFIYSNSIKACIDEEQVITNGARVKLRLLEPIQVQGVTIYENSHVFGVARIDGQRLQITITSIEASDNIIPVNLLVHDIDGQLGIYIPNSMERTAAKDAAASIGQSFGTSISVASSAKQQVAMDLTRGALTGGTQYLASKLREVKVTLKANHQVLLTQKQ